MRFSKGNNGENHTGGVSNIAREAFENRDIVTLQRILHDPNFSDQTRLYTANSLSKIQKSELRIVDLGCDVEYDHCGPEIYFDEYQLIEQLLEAFEVLPLMEKFDMLQRVINNSYHHEKVRKVAQRLLNNYRLFMCGRTYEKPVSVSSVFPRDAFKIDVV